MFKFTLEPGYTYEVDLFEHSFPHVNGGDLVLIFVLNVFHEKTFLAPGLF